MRVLIVEDGRQRGALAAVRSLGRAGHEVAVAAPVVPLAGRSRWCSRMHRVSASWNPAASMADIRDVVRTNGYDMVFAVGDSECLMLAAARDELDAALGVVDHGSLLSALDKSVLSAAAEKLGIRVPRILDAIPDRVPPEGIIVKERVHGQENDGGRAFSSAPVLVYSRAEGLAAAADVAKAGGTPLIQEVIQGELVAYCVARDKRGRTVGELQQRALRTFPPAAGVSVRAISIPVDPVLRKNCSDLLDGLDMWGIAEIQFIAPAQGSPWLIDVNPRFYGSMALAMRAGVDLPVLLTSITLDEEVAAVPPARTGVRYQWLEGDIRRALTERRHGRIPDLLSCMSFAPGAVHSIFDARDPRPAARFAAQLLRRQLKKGGEPSATRA